MSPLNFAWRCACWQCCHEWQQDAAITGTLKAAVIYDDFDFAARTAALLERAAIRPDEAMQWHVNE